MCFDKVFVIEWGTRHVTTAASRSGAPVSRSPSPGGSEQVREDKLDPVGSLSPTMAGDHHSLSRRTSSEFSHQLSP